VNVNDEHGASVRGSDSRRNRGYSPLRS
jgi:hypothetical protein